MSWKKEKSKNQEAGEQLAVAGQMGWRAFEVAGPMGLGAFEAIKAKSRNAKFGSGEKYHCSKDGL